MSNQTPRAFIQEEEENFNLTSLFASYVSKPEITALSPSYLVPGSKNVLVDYAQRVISRNGYTLYRAESTGAGGIKGSFEWENSIGKQISLRSFDHTLQFDWNGAYNTLLSNLRSAYLEFATVLDYNEQQDILLFVNGDGTQMHRWGGGVSKVASSTAVTLTKAGVLTSKTTIAFVAGVAGVTAPTITDSANGFVTAGFAAGDTLSITGSTSSLNDSNFTIGSVAAGTITLIMSDVLVSQPAGASITMYNQTGPTWKSAHFLSSISPRKITYNGVDYAYTGGEATDTLTGLVAFPVVAVGDAVWQTPDVIALPSAVTSPFPLFYPDLIGVQLNMVFLGSTKSSMIMGSSNIDYTSFTLTTPRVPGGPVQQPLTSGHCTCIVPMNTVQQTLATQNTLLFGSGLDSFDQIDFRLSQDNAAELLRIIRLKTAVSSGVISKSAICPIKDDTIYISREPALDGLSGNHLQAPDGQRNVPISDPIKNDFDSYNFTNAHVKYFNRAIYIALPSEGLVLIYDMMRHLWQPPQTIPVSRFAIIADELYGHSAVTNETYKLFVGTDDNGLAIQQVARFAYNNGGNRTRLKNMTEEWSDGYITASGELLLELGFGYAGSLGTQTYSISGADSDIVVTEDATSLGDEGEGLVPLGGSPFSASSGLPGAGTPLLRFHQIDTVSMVDYQEHYVQYSMNSLGGQFAIVAHGSNQFDAGTVDILHKK